MVIYDNINQELNPLDIVIIGVTENSMNVCKVGVYYDTFVFIMGLGATENKGTVDMKRYNMFTRGEREMPINRVMVEMGRDEHKELTIKGIIKQENPTEDMMIMRSVILDKIQKGQLKGNIDRSLTNRLLHEAEEQGRI